MTGSEVTAEASGRAEGSGRGGRIHSMATSSATPAISMLTAFIARDQANRRGGAAGGAAEMRSTEICQVVTVRAQLSRFFERQPGRDGVSSFDRAFDLLNQCAIAAFLNPMLESNPGLSVDA
jgi:hypothetical protein